MSSNIGDLTGQQLGTCVLEKLIGQGGMGAVYLARQVRPSRNVAVKILQPNLGMSSQVYQEFLVRFRREADVIARLEHSNIIPIYEYGEQNGLAYLVMPYLSGGSLRDVLSKRGPLPPQEAARYIDQAAEALDYAHSQGVIHRDLKPANFLLHADGRLMLADFGIARMMEESKPGAALTSTGTILGTPEYMPPEMARGEAIDYRVDIYELGIVLFQMLAGRVPFAGGSAFAVIAKHVQEPVPLLHQLNPSLPPAIDGVIQKATAKRREDRYTTTVAMARDFHNALGASLVQSPVIDQGNAPTVMSSGHRPVILPHAPAQVPPYATPPGQRPYPATAPSQPSWPNTTVPQAPYSSQGTPPYHTPYPQAPHRQQPLLIIIGIGVMIALLIGGIYLGIQFSRIGQTPTPTPTSTTATTPSQTATGATTPATTATTTQPTTTPTNAPTPIPTTPTALIPVGNQLYAAATPGPTCDKGSGKWIAYNNAAITCSSTTTHISNTASDNLQGTFLTEIPGQAYPANYVIQLQLQPDQQSSGDYGIYFRNQPGQQQGVYTFMIHSDGTWSAFVYDNTTGAPKELQKGQFGDAHAPVTLDIVVNGDKFTFYANGKSIGSTSDATFASGTAGIAVDKGASIAVSNFALYMPAP